MPEGSVEDSGLNEPEGEGVVEDSGLNEPEGEGVKGELAGKAGDRTFQPPRSGARSGLCGHFSRMDHHADALRGIRLAVLWLAVRVT